MKIRTALMAIGVAASAGPAGAQPGKDDRAAKAPPVVSAPVVLASATDVPRPAAADRAAQPVRRPAPRVTTCRCGDPQASQDQPDDSQPDE